MIKLNFYYQEYFLWNQPTLLAIFTTNLPIKFLIFIVTKEVIVFAFKFMVGNE